MIKGNVTRHETKQKTGRRLKLLMLSENETELRMNKRCADYRL